MIFGTKRLMIESTFSKARFELWFGSSEGYTEEDAHKSVLELFL